MVPVLVGSRFNDPMAAGLYRKNAPINTVSASFFCLASFAATYGINPRALGSPGGDIPFLDWIL